MSSPSAQMVMADTIQKEFLITRTTTKKELTVIQRLLADHNYILHIGSEIFNNNDLLHIGGYMKFKPSAGKSWSFDISNFESIRITINMDNERGTFQMDTVTFKVKNK